MEAIGHHSFSLTGCTCGWSRVIVSTKSQYSGSGFGADCNKVTRSTRVKTAVRRRAAACRFTFCLPDRILLVRIPLAGFRRAMELPYQNTDSGLKESPAWALR